MVALTPTQSVRRGLGINTNLRPEFVVSVKFEPTIGIAAARIDKLGLDIRSFRVPLGRAIRQVMVPSIRKNFDVSGRPAWEPLAESTQELRAQRGISSSRVLVVSGALVRVASQINIWTVTTTTAVINDLPQKVWYGKVHQGGYEGSSMGALVRKHSGDVGKANAEHTARLLAAVKSGTAIAGSGGTSTIPARPFLDIQPEDIDEIEVIFIVWLTERLEAAWPAGVR